MRATFAAKLTTLTLLVTSVATVGCAGGFSPMSEMDNQSLGAPLTAEQKAFEAILRNDCNMCHGQRPGDGNVYLFDTNALITANYLIPGDPSTSPVYMNTLGGHHGRIMSAADSLLVEDWVNSLSTPAPTPTPTPTPTATPVPTPTPAPLTKDQFFTANVGPGGSSTYSLLSVKRCANCHYSGGSTYDPAATSFLIIDPTNAALTLSRLKAVKVGTATYDMTKKVGTTYSNTVYQFAVGHKAKNPAYSAAEIQHIKDFVDRP